MAKRKVLLTGERPFYLFLLFLFFPFLIYSQDKVNGRVIDKRTDEPIIGASIAFPGARTGTITDIHGYFSFPVEKELPVVLHISYMGYRTEEINIYDLNELILVELTENLNYLEGVVVVGYGTQKRRDITGSVASLKDKDLNMGIATSVDQLLQGISAGVQVQQSSSEPGGGISVRIRGGSSVNAGNEPLYVIDGLPIDNSSTLSASTGQGALADNQSPRNPLNSLNTNDIESIEILKDASATAIYGSRGANGVVIITTKRGRKDGTSVNYSFNAGVQQVAKKIDVLSTNEYIRVMNELSVERGGSTVFSANDINRIGKGTDWQDEIFRNAFVQSHNLSLSGGNERTNYYTSFNYLSQDGVVKNTGIDKYILRLNVESKLGSRGKVGVNVNTSIIEDKNSIDGNGFNEQGGPINSALLYDPTETVYDSEGNFTESAFLTINNPVSIIKGVSSKSRTNRSMGNAYIEYGLTDELSAKVNFGADLQQIRRDIYNSRITIRGSAANGIASIATLERSSYLAEYTMNYHKQLFRKGSLNALAGVTYQSFENRLFSGSISDFPSDNLGTNNLGLGDIGTAGLDSNKEKNALLSYLARVNYSWNERYLFTASLRADGSSRFGENNKFGYFPSFAAGWRLAEEHFIPSFFNDLKLRASWGITGNQDISNYASLSTYSSGGNFVVNNSTIVGTQPSRIANPDLKWESTAQTNIGVDASFLRERIHVSIDYFIKNTHDMLIDLPIPQATGYSSILSNIGSMRNSGFELSVGSENIRTRSFSWQTSFNLSVIRNKVTDLGDVKNIITGYATNIGSTAIVTKGKPAFSYYGYKVVGVFQTEAEVAASAQSGAKPGYPIFEDVNKDGQITTDDQQIIGNPYPDFTFGLQNNFTYKNFSLDFSLQGQVGGEVLNGNIVESLYPSNTRRNMITETALDRWTPNNSAAKWPSATQPSEYGGGKVNTLALQDASYLRLKYIQLTYNLPVKNISFLSGAQVYICAQNLLTISNYIGYDPEANTFGNSSARIDLNTYPLARTWSAGVNLSF